MKNIVNIAFYEYDKKTIHLIDLVNICEKAQNNKLFFTNVNNNLHNVLYIFSEYILNCIFNSPICTNVVKSLLLQLIIS